MNPMLGKVLGGVFGQAMGRRGMAGMSGGMRGGMRGGLGGAAMGSMLGGMLGGGRRGMRRGGGRSALVLMLLPVAMRWVQRNGGIGAVLDRFRQKGYGSQMQSWVGTGANQPLDDRAVEEVVGHHDLQQMAQELDVPEPEARQAFAEVMPELVNQLTPDGQLPQDADQVLDEGRQTMEREIQDVQVREPPRS